MAATESLTMTYWVLDALCAAEDAQPVPRKRRGHRCNVSGPLMAPPCAFPRACRLPQSIGSAQPQVFPLFDPCGVRRHAC